MSRAQLTVLSVSIILLAGLYLFGPTVAEKEPVVIEEKKVDLAEVAADLLPSLVPDIRDSINSTDDLLTLSSIWETTGHMHIAAHYAERAGELKQAGKNYLIAYSSGVDTTLNHFLLHKAIEVYTMATEEDPSDLDARISLAACHLESQEEVMQGVQLLLGVVKQDSLNIKANVMLARWGIFSGQYEKAIKRLEKVVPLEPQNLEALFLLGQAYEESGNSEKAEEYFAICREIVARQERKE